MRRSRLSGFAWVASCCLSLAMAASARAENQSRTIARCGEGFLEEVDGYRVLHLKGTPYAMGYQHGALLRDDIRQSIHYLFEVKGKEMKVEVAGLSLLSPKKVIAGIAATQKKYVPERFFEEMKGIADGAGMDVQDVITANFIPEMFHCSGFALCNSATKGGKLYHGRILDYGCDWQLQDHAILTIAEPVGKIPFVNVGYAGFVGSVTGMNAERISIGEMGGKGLGHWEGVPMALLVRMALEEADDLEHAIAIFRENPRTCEYYYVIADGESNKAVGMEASWNVFTTVSLGEKNDKLPEAIEDAVALSAGDRYKELVKRIRAGHGTFDADSARRLMDRPVAMKDNLHSVLFETTTTRLWVANATKDGKPAADQPYHAFNFRELLTRQPGPSAPVLTPPPAPPVRQANADR